MASQPRIVHMTSSPREDKCCPGRSPRYNSNQGFSSGMMQVICGVCTLLLGGVFFALVFHVIDTGAGVWCGVFIFIPTGVLGIFTRGKRTGLIIAYLVMCLLSCLTSLIMACFVFYWAWYWRPYCTLSKNCNNITIYQTIQALIGIIMVVEFVGAVLGAHACCQVLPTKSTPHNEVHFSSPQRAATNKGDEPNRRYR